ncbi:MAG: hypothetical protein OEU78_04155 [Gammaproteobacteria bacterium]|jgi:hypothetical protein|nr:hypothetical protein [Gammaproteobacteria bacterium]MDH3887678.1 hypothetical protein [Gammaproteobacteria bacterium]
MLDYTCPQTEASSPGYFQENSQRIALPENTLPGRRDHVRIIASN